MIRTQKEITIPFENSLNADEILKNQMEKMIYSRKINQPCSLSAILACAQKSHEQSNYDGKDRGFCIHSAT